MTTSIFAPPSSPTPAKPEAPALGEPPISTQRVTRYSTVFPIQKLQDTPLTLIGLGGVGRNLAMLLARSGVKHVQLWDHDRVEAVNLGPQGWYPDDIGCYKVVACADEMETLNPDMDIDVMSCKFTPETALNPKHKVVFCMVDDIEARGKLFQAFHPKLDLWVDCRTTIDCLQLYAWTPKHAPKVYLDTIFPKSESLSVPCTARSTPEINALVAAMAMGAYTRWLRNAPVPHTMMFDLLSWTADPTF